LLSETCVFTLLFGKSKAFIQRAFAKSTAVIPTILSGAQFCFIESYLSRSYSSLILFVTCPVKLLKMVEQGKYIIQTFLTPMNGISAFRSLFSYKKNKKMSCKSLNRTYNSEN